jgi:aspartyl aminopeptidase
MTRPKQVEQAMPDKKTLKTALDLIDFISASPTAAHAVSESARRLDSAGFKRVEEKDAWKNKPGDKFYVVRDRSAIVACRIGSKPPEKAGFRLVGAHTDTPGLRLKPNAVYSQGGYIQLGVEIYGGPILASWLDRDLGLAGRVVIREKDGSLKTQLVYIDKPVCRIPNLAIHMARDVNNEGLKIDKQTQLPPLLGLGDEAALEEQPLRKLLADSAGVKPEKIESYRLDVVDIQPGTLGGMSDEFIFTPRYDNLASCHAGIEGIIAAPAKTPFTQVVALFDNEEVGSTSAAGAGSRFLDNVLERLCLKSDNPREAFFRAMNASVMISVDGAHAVHPNYPEAHDPHHMPMLNGGPVVKVNANERYTTDIEALEHLNSCAARAKVKLQTFVARSDKPCGSTIGPMTAARLGIDSVDIGNPMIAMHSIREMAGAEDQLSMIKLLTEHFS